MYTLYYSPGTCSMAVHVVLEELEVPYKLVNANGPDGARTQEFLKLGTRTSVPVLVEDGTVIREGGAILSYLLDKHNSPMMPKSGIERAKALEWLMFANATMHPAYSRTFFLLRNMADSDAKKDILKASIEGINKLWAELDAELGKTPYICGQECSVADILLTVIANWGQSFQPPVVRGENVKRMLKAVISRPSYQKALKTEAVEYKAAA